MKLLIFTKLGMINPVIKIPIVLLLAYVYNYLSRRSPVERYGLKMSSLIS